LHPEDLAREPGQVAREGPRRPASAPAAATAAPAALAAAAALAALALPRRRDILINMINVDPLDQHEHRGERVDRGEPGPRRAPRDRAGRPEARPDEPRGDERRRDARDRLPDGEPAGAVQAL